MTILNTPPQLILPDHFVANRPAIIRPVADLASYFPVELDRKTKRAIVKELAKRGLVDDRAALRKEVEAAIPFGMFAPGPNIRGFSFLGADSIDRATASTTTFSFSIDCGTANPYRLIVIGLGFFASGNSDFTWTVTIGGFAATCIAGSVYTSSQNDAEFHAAIVPTGSGALTIDCTPSNVLNSCGIAVYGMLRINGGVTPYSKWMRSASSSGTAITTASGGNTGAGHSGSAHSASLATPAGGVALFTGNTLNGSDMSVGGSGTKDVGQDMRSGEWQIAASAYPTAASGAFGITTTTTGATSMPFAAVSFD